MEMVLMIIGGILMLVGLIGCLLPFLPGPPLSFAGLLIQQFRSDPPFEANFLWIWAAITVVVVALDYVVPVYGTKKFGGTKYGVWGSVIGLIAGFWLGPLGIIIGPFLGALIGEMLVNSDSQKALRAALGSFIGFLVGTLVKLVACGIMTYYFVTTLWA